METEELLDLALENTVEAGEVCGREIERLGQEIKTLKAILGQVEQLGKGIEILQAVLKEAVDLLWRYGAEEILRESE